MSFFVVVGVIEGIGRQGKTAEHLIYLSRSYLLGSPGVDIPGYIPRSLRKVCSPVWGVGDAEGSDRPGCLCCSQPPNPPRRRNLHLIPLPLSRKEGKVPLGLIPPNIVPGWTGRWLPHLLFEGRTNCRSPHDRTKYFRPSDALRKATPEWPSAGSSSAEHIPPLLFSFSPTLNKTTAVVFIGRAALGITYAGPGERERGFVLLKQHLISRRSC